MSCMFSIKELFSRESELRNGERNQKHDDNGLSKRVWIYPGDGFYTYPEEGKQGKTRPTNFLGIRWPLPSISNTSRSSTSTSNGNCSNTGNNINVKFTYDIVHVSTSKTPSDQFCFVVLSNGEVHAHTFDADIHKWVFNFIFNLKPSSDNESESGEQCSIKSVVFDDDLTSVIWCQTLDSTSAFKSSLFYRQISLTPLASVSNLSINTYPSVCILNHCPELSLTFLDGFISCLLEPSSKLNIFLTWSGSSQLSLHNTDGEIILDSLSHNIDFPEVLSETIGLWSDSGDKCIYQVANKVHNTLYILTQQSKVLCINKSETVGAKVKLSPSVASENVKGFFVYGLMIVLFTLERVLVHYFECGKLLYEISLDQYEPLVDTWYFTSATSGSGFGFYGAKKVFQLLPESYEESLLKCDVNLVKIYSEDSSDWAFLSKINELLLNKDGKKLELLSPSLQSPGLCLALMHNFKMKNNVSSILSCSISLDKLSINDNVGTRLSKILWPLVESFIKLEKFRAEMISD